MAAPRRPNFVIVFADDLGWGDLGCFGSPNIRTPRIDAMAREGARLTNFYAQPICGPSRAALMTGCYPMRLAERDNKKHLHPVLHSKEVTLAEVLKRTGRAGSAPKRARISPDGRAGASPLCASSLRTRF